MHDNQLQKVINLAKKTGDRVIVFDSTSSNNPYVVMGLEEYEKLVVGHSEVRGLTENELLDKINRDVAIWKSDNDFDSFEQEIIDNSSDFEHINKFIDNSSNLNNDEPIKNIYQDDFSSPGLKEMKENIFKRQNTKNGWSIPRDRKRAAEEVVDEDEDRQYLEELPF